ncbi:Gluconate 2-dehydrogenase cytochrome c subunit precursor [Serratia rubidaea]|uniref:Gluconate 2-dehydrogenase cytochrome c subunit n=1 Tax=Serratia rubidaea TaxID=61652 RepID=A0A447QT74_SERRU|nr:Gluconate 2-dehydrogenase cytochrome c subunit precursor [Serratia rubidaea]
MNKKTLLALMLAAAPLWAHGDQALIKRGEYLARAADCTACHTAPAARRLAAAIRSARRSA